MGSQFSHPILSAAFSLGEGNRGREWLLLGCFYQTEDLGLQLKVKRAGPREKRIL